jgi:hypothetical protein|nr:MAG TPA_asm: hypothetical protein [Caudoviricetes sp.]DAM94949.1 MAG TPA: hypothetical protein [Caudoviricetes sp.]DAO51086.1 MAG TPA: hypothetical protein [Caudoviricetes sp.]DAQ45202.1 MAG TPA: hypothetical protein [Caudoviricetes sp.]DAZ59746.1 MAG TPA: hypothetical protein [Caudoviricetes sp.]
MRLIDADKIIDSLGNSDMDFAIGAVIDEQPTVFDVDKVVERLEEEKKRAFKLCLGTNDSTQRLKYIEKEQTIALAIEIVKGGGVE